MRCRTRTLITATTRARLGMPSTSPGSWTGSCRTSGAWRGTTSSTSQPSSHSVPARVASRWALARLAPFVPSAPLTGVASLGPIDQEVLRIRRRLVDLSLEFVVVIVDQAAKGGAVVVGGPAVLEATSPDGGAEIGGGVQILVSHTAILGFRCICVVTPNRLLLGRHQPLDLELDQGADLRVCGPPGDRTPNPRIKSWLVSMLFVLSSVAIA